MMIGKDCVVSINYTLTNDSGETLDQSPEGQPLLYLHGADGIIPGLEKELAGKAIGADFKVTIAPEEGYGEHQPHLVQEAPKEAFGEHTPEVGMQFTANTEQGEIPVRVTAISDATITVDANHPLAGMTLNFEGNIADVRMATAEELDHGHVH